MNLSHEPNALIVGDPDMVSARWLSSGELVVETRRTDSLIPFFDYISRQYEINRITGSIRARYGRTMIPMTIE